MIELNILKTRLEGFRRKRVILNLFIIYFGGLLLILMILSMNFVNNKVQIKKIRGEIKGIEDNITQEKEIVGYIKTREKESERLLKGMELFSSEIEKRVLWSHILYFVGQNVPSGIWLERLAMKEISKDKSDKKKEKIIAVDGYVLPEVINERKAIDRFVRDMSRGNMFSGVYLKEVKKEVRDHLDVQVFKVECEIK